MGSLVFPGRRGRRRDPVAVSRSWRRHARASCDGVDGTYSDAASLVRGDRLRNRNSEWISRNAREVATILQEGLAHAIDRSGCSADTIHGVVVRIRASLQKRLTEEVG